MDVFLGGAERSNLLRRLNDYGVTSVAVSFYEWQRRHDTYDVGKVISDDTKVCVLPGVARKKSVDFEAFARDYLEFCERNAERCTLYDLDASAVPGDVRRLFRRGFEPLPNSVIFPAPGEDLEQLCDRHERIGINARLAKSLPIPELRRLRASLYGSNITDAAILGPGRFLATTTLAWLGPQRFGELWVFARNRLLHFPAESAAKEAKAHAHSIVELGVDPLACASGDKEALTRLAVLSVLAMSDHLSRRPRDRFSSEVRDASEDGPGAEIVPLHDYGDAVPVRGGLAERARTTVPVISVITQDGRPKVDSVGISLRQCDTCYLSGNCPRYEAQASCAFSWPVEFETDAQWEAAFQALLEIQFGRISFAAMAEQIEGGSLSPRVGQEMDRFSKMLRDMKDLKTPVQVSEGSILDKIFKDLLPKSEDGDNEEAELVQEGFEDEDLGAIAGEASDDLPWDAGEGQGSETDDEA